MEPNILNYLKKQEQLDIEYMKIGDYNDLQFHIFKKKIIPSKIIKDKKAFQITYLSRKFHLYGFIIITKNNKIQKMILNGDHPNCDHKTNEFCLDNKKINAEFNIKILEEILTNLSTYYLDNCYYIPRYKYMKYKEIESIFINIDKNEVIKNYGKTKKGY